MRRIALIIGILSMVTSKSIAQGSSGLARSELGVGFGGMYYTGDLNPFGHFKNIKPAVNLIYRYNLTMRFNLRATATYGTVYASDHLSNDEWQQNRNLDFRSRIAELAIGTEINIFRYRTIDNRYPATGYFFFEAALFHMNPQGKNGNEWVDLQPLGTEGQGIDGDKQYKKVQLGLPFGLGFKFNVVPKVMAVSLEYGIRYTFTDYLDDVSTTYADPGLLEEQNGPLAAQMANKSLVGYSQTGLDRGNPETNDWYSYFNIMITFQLKKDTCHYPR